MVTAGQDQRDITCMERTFAIVRTADGNCYISIPALCDALGLIVGSQVRRVKRNEQLFAGLRHLQLTTKGGIQRVNCLHITCLQAWFDGIQTGSLSSEAQETLQQLQTALPPLLSQAFSEQAVLSDDSCVSAVLPEASQSKDVSPKSRVPVSSPASTGISVERQRALLANTLRYSPDSKLIVNGFEEDTAFRESCLADEQDWLQDGSVYYEASNHIRVYLCHPNETMDLTLAHEQIKKIGVTTVLVARIALGLWNSRRYDHRLSENGSVAIALHEILAWRGLKKHTKAVSSGSAARMSDGYDVKYKRQIYRDFFHLQRCYLRGEYTRFDSRGRARQLIIDGPYMRVSIVWERNLWGEEEIAGFLVSPGDWITTHAGTTFGYFGLLDQRIFQLHPQRDQLALRIALYLIDRWSRQAQRSQRVGHPSSYEEPITMQELLTASMISFDPKTFPLRFKERIEAALFKLFEQKILGDIPRSLPDTHEALAWRQQWLSSQWILLPRLDVITEAVPSLPSPLAGPTTTKRVLTRGKPETKE
jgi:hypothetical protein